MRRAVICLTLLVALTGCSSGEDVSAFCDRHAAARASLGPVGAANFRRAIGEVRALADIAPAEIATDARFYADRMAGLGAETDRLESGELTWDEFGAQYLGPFYAEPDVAAANARVEAFVAERCPSGD